MVPLGAVRHADRPVGLAEANAAARLVPAGQQRAALGDRGGPGPAPGRGRARAARGVAVAAARVSAAAGSCARSTSCPASGSARPATRSRTGMLAQHVEVLVDAAARPDGPDAGHRGGPGRAPVMAPGEVSVIDAHYGSPRPPPARKSAQKRGGEGVLRARAGRAAVAAQRRRLGQHPPRTELEELAGARSRPRRRGADRGPRAGDHVRPVAASGVRSILAAGTGVAQPTAPGEALVIELPATAVPVAGRLPARRPHRRGRVMTAAKPAPLAADLEHGLRRLKLASMRRVAPELLVTAKTQRWTPEELLRALVETEIAARDASNVRLRSKQASFPTLKTIDEFDLTASSIPPATWSYLCSPRVDRREGEPDPDRAGRDRQEPHPDRPRVTPRSTRDCRSATSPPPSSSRTSTAAWPTTASAGSSRPSCATTSIIVDEVGFAPLDSTGSQLLFRFVAAAYERRSLAHRQPLAVRGMGPVPARAHHRRQPARPAPAPQQRRRHRRRELPHARSPNQYRRPPHEALTHHARWGLSLATSGDLDLAVDRRVGV